MINTDIRNMQESIIELINSYDTPIEVKRLVLGNVYMLVEKEANNTIRKEVKDAESAQDN